MDEGAQALPTVLTGEEHESLERDKVSVIKNEFMNFKLWKINTINIHFFIRQERKVGTNQKIALPIQKKRDRSA